MNGDKEVMVWGTGSPLREFLHVDDLAEACYFLMDHYSDPQTINVGFGEDLSIKDLAITVKEVVGFEGELVFDTSKPDGTPRKLMSSERLRALGWEPRIGLKEVITQVYREVDKDMW